MLSGVCTQHYVTGPGRIIEHLLVQEHNMQALQITLHIAACCRLAARKQGSMPMETRFYLQAFERTCLELFFFIRCPD